MSRFFCKLHRETNRVKNVAIHRCIDEGYGLIDFHGKNTDSPHEIVACLPYAPVGEKKIAMK